MAFQDSSSVIVGNINATGVSTVAAGTVSAPAITTTGDTNTGIYFIAADLIGIATGGTERMRIDSNGNVGIAYNSPSSLARFAVQDSGGGAGTIAMLSSTASNVIYLKNTGTEARFMYNDAYPMTFGTNSAERMRITSTGDVGIGTTSPNLNSFNKELTVSAGTSGTARAGINIQGSRTTDSTFGALSYYHQANLVGSVEMIRGGADNSGIMQFFTANAGTIAERMRITAAGNVGIGQTSVTDKLEVTGSILINGGVFKSER
jgi:hypothetical protein